MSGGEKGMQGTVKWFSNRKGFGFIASDALSEEIFVHQTGIVTDGQFRTLQENTEVKFDVEKEPESGKLKAVNVTNTDGSPIVPPPRQSRRARKGKEGEEEKNEGGDAAGAAEAKAPDQNGAANTDGATADEGANENAEASSGKPKGGRNRGRGRNNRRNDKKPESENNNTAGDGEGAAATGANDSAQANDDTAAGTNNANNNNNKNNTPRDPPFHAVLTEEVKKQVEEERSLVLGNRTTVDVAFAPHARIKLGQGGYAGLCLQTAVIAEGTYTCDAAGLVNFTWARALKCEEGSWKPHPDLSSLMKSFSLVDEHVGPVQPNETAATLFGADKPDPREAFEANGFQMRRVVLTRPPNRFRRGGGGGGGRGNRGPRNNNNNAGGGGGAAAASSSE